MSYKGVCVKYSWNLPRVQTHTFLAKYRLRCLSLKVRKMYPAIYCFLLSSLISHINTRLCTEGTEIRFWAFAFYFPIWPKGVLLLLSLYARKITVQAFKGVSLISIFVAVDVKMFFLSWLNHLFYAFETSIAWLKWWANNLIGLVQIY